MQKMPVFSDYSRTNRTAENGLLGSEAATFPAFLRRAIVQSGFNDRTGRMQCDQNLGILP
jgi:hypothetical protein